MTGKYDQPTEPPDTDDPQNPAPFWPTCKDCGKWLAFSLDWSDANDNGSCINPDCPRHGKEANRGA